MEENKSELRRKLRKNRDALSDGPIGNIRMQRIQEHLLSSHIWQNCCCVALYVSIKGEADTSLLLECAWREGRQVFLPRCRPDEPGHMDMLECSCRDDLEVSPLGIPEPRMKKNITVLSHTELQSGADTLVIVPAFAFDYGGYRLGYGGGYYDRMLTYAHCHSVGLCFQDLFLPRIPRDVWDIPVGYVCTEENLYCIRD